MNITIELPEKQYFKLLEIAKIAKIKPEKILEVFLQENFFNQQNDNYKVKVVNDEEKIENFLHIFKEKFKELEVTQDDLSKIFKTSIPTISKALSGKQENFVYKKFKKAYEDNSMEDFLKNTYLSILIKYFPNIDDRELIELSEKNNVFKYYLGFINKKLDDRFNEGYFLNNIDLEKLIKELEEIPLQNLSADEIFGKFTYLYENL